MLADIFSPLVKADHLHAVAFETDANAFLAEVGMGGGFPAPASDSLLVTNVNAVGNKIDTFLERSVVYRAEVDPGTGDTTGTLTVTLHNAAPGSDLPMYVIGSPLRPRPPLGTNRTQLFVYSSLPATSATVDGTPVGYATNRTDGRFLHQVELDIGPDATAVVVLQLAGSLPTHPYSLELRPGGGVAPDPYAVHVTAGSEPLARYDGIVTQPIDASA